jgi:hypothetical protein
VSHTTGKILKDKLASHQVDRIEAPLAIEVTDVGAV